MNRRERALVLHIYRDCLRLEKAGQLSEFGLGELYLCRLLLNLERGFRRASRA